MMVYLMPITILAGMFLGAILLYKAITWLDEWFDQ